MSKRTVFTTISPLPQGITRQIVLDFLHSHIEMIDLNPLVTDRHPINPPPHATADETRCVWYSLTDKISYLPGGKATGDVSYTCAFHDLPNGLQTHVYAPMGLDIRDKWTLAGSLPGEPVQPVELGLGAPVTGLYIREDVDMRCNVFMAAFVKKTLKKAHAALVEKLASKAQMVSAAEREYRESVQGPRRPSSATDKPLPAPPRRDSMGMAMNQNNDRGFSPAYHQDMYASPVQMNAQPLPPQQQSLSLAEQWVQQQQQQQQFAGQGSMYSQPTVYRVPTIRRNDSISESPAAQQPMSAFPEPLRMRRPSNSVGSLPYFPPATIRDEQGKVVHQPLRPAPSVVRWAGAKEKDYSEFAGMNPFGDDSGVGRQPTVRHGEYVHLQAQQYQLRHAASQGNMGRVAQPFIAELE